MGASSMRGFVAEGANVAIADVLEQEGRTLADELGDHSIFSRLDVTTDRGLGGDGGRRRGTPSARSPCWSTIRASCGPGADCGNRPR